MARDAKLLSEAHFTVDGSLIDAWASMKSFRPRDDQDSNGENFHGERRSNETHESKTDREARLYRKGPGKEAKLCYSMNILTENRHGLIVDLSMEIADGRSDSAITGLDRRTTRHVSYQLSQRARKLVEQPFGWMKAFSGFRKSRFIGRARTELTAQLTAATYNLLRIAKLLAT